MAARQQVAQPNLKPTIMVLGSLLAVAATGFGFIGTPILWVALLMAGWSAQPPILSGKKDGGGRPTPAHPGEVAQMSKYRFWSDIRWRLLVPTGDWFPLTIGRWWPLASWFGAVWAGLFVYKVIPTSNTMNTEALAGLANVTPTVNGLFLFICLAQIAASRRRSMTAGDECPGVRLDSFIAVVKKPGLAFELKALGGTVAGVLAGFIGDNLYLLGVPGTHPSGVNLWLYVFTVPFGFIAAVYKDWDEEALGHWRGVAAARLEWEPRWPQLKIDPAPYVTDRKRLGPASMDTFQAAGSIPASTFTAPLMLGKIAPILGTGTRLAALEHPGVDSQGQPLQGTTHPLDFDLISWPVDQLPDLMTETDPEIVREYVRSAMSWAAPQMGLLSAVLNEIQKISVEGSPVVYVTTWSHPTGGHAATIRAARGTLANELQAHVLVDDQQSLVFFGQLDGELELDPEFGVTAEQIKNLQIEDEWNKRWYEVQKQGVNPPVIEHGLYKTAELADGTVIHMQPFMTRQGIEPDEFFAHSDKLSTTLDQASFVNVTGWTKGAGKRAGERHPQAFCVYWNDFGRHVAARPDELRPAPGDAPKWVLASHINKAFTAARLARPEVVSAKCFTAPESRTHIWEVSLRLYGGVTLADVRGMANKIRTAMGTEWMRVAATEDGCKIVCGAQPRKVKLNRPRDAAYLTSLDWEQAWLDSKVTGVASQTPKLLSVGNLPHNEQVEVLEFELPPGLDVTAVKAARTKLETATSNMFIEVRRGDKANQVTVLACEINPMPLMVGMDFDAIDASDGIPFATGVEGEPVVFDPSSAPHALLAGTTGSGKSVLAQGFVYGFAVKGADIYIIDPSKGAADFKFVEDHARAIARTTAEAAGVLKMIYAEVVRRKNLNSEAGVGSYSELADPPPPLIVMIDEFTSLMGQSPVPKPNDDPEMDSERDEIILDNANRATIGIITGKLAREARSAGVTLLLGTQKLSAKLLDSVPGGGDLKVNLARVLLGKTSSGDRMSALRAFDEAPPMGDSIPKGRGLWEPLTHSAVMIQAWYASQADLGDNLRARRPVLPLEERVDMSQFEVEEANQVAYTSPAAGQEEETTEHAEVSLDELDAMLAELDAEDPDQTASDTAPFDQTASDQTVLEEVQGQDDGWPEPAPEPEPTQSPVSAEPFELSQIDWSGWDSVPSQYGFPRIDAVLAWLEINPQITDVEWAEPLLTPALTEMARAAFAESGVTLHSPQATLVTEVPNEFADTQGFALPSVDKSRLPDGFDF